MVHHGTITDLHVDAKAKLRTRSTMLPSAPTARAVLVSRSLRCLSHAVFHATTNVAQDYSCYTFTHTSSQSSDVPALNENGSFKESDIYTMQERYFFDGDLHDMGPFR